MMGLHSVCIGRAVREPPTVSTGPTKKTAQQVEPVELIAAVWGRFRHLLTSYRHCHMRLRSTPLRPKSMAANTVSSSGKRMKQVGISPSQNLLWTRKLQAIHQELGINAYVELAPNVECNSVNLPRLSHRSIHAFSPADFFFIFANWVYCYQR